MAPGKFITFEGGEGAGKSTHVARLAERLRAGGHEVAVTREPGGTPGAEEIRALLVTGDAGRWTPLAEALLHYAAREDHLARVVRPALARGDWVICDRFADSTMAYQGYGHGLGPEPIDALYRLVVGDSGPDLTLILDLPVEQGLARIGDRDGDEHRYESMDHEFHERMRRGFLDIAARAPERCVVIDAGSDIEVVAGDIWQAVTSRLDP